MTPNATDQLLCDRVHRDTLPQVRASLARHRDGGQRPEQGTYEIAVNLEQLVKNVGLCVRLSMYVEYVDHSIQQEKRSSLDLRRLVFCALYHSLFHPLAQSVLLVLVPSYA